MQVSLLTLEEEDELIEKLEGTFLKLGQDNTTAAGYFETLDNAQKEKGKDTHIVREPQESSKEVMRRRRTA